MAINKEYCCSSFLAFRYIYEKDMDFADGLKHEHFVQIPDSKKILVKTAKDVDEALKVQFDKLKGKKLGASILFVGDDWYGTEKWKHYEEEFNKAGIRIVYFPYTRGISSTKINDALEHLQK